MATRLTDSEVRDAIAPATGNRIAYDTEVRGFGLRITAAGAKAFVLNYRAAGRERRITIGSFPDWSTKAAREQAKSLKRQIDLGEDPMAERHAEREAETVAELCDLFERDHLPQRRSTTQEDYRSLMRLYIRPELGKIKVKAVQRRDIAALHRKIALRDDNPAPYRANRMLAVMSAMMAIAVKEGLRTDNPCQGVDKADEQKRERFLSPAEISRLGEALAAHPEKTTVNAIRLLLLTGARRGEVLSATWDQFELGTGVWTKPSSSTKQKKPHRLPLSAPAQQLLLDMRREASPGCRYVFPSSKPSRRRGPDGKAIPAPLTEIKRTWATVCRKAGLSVQVKKVGRNGRPVVNAKGDPVMTWEATVRLHDLRHTHASILASLGLSLPIIGALLGHTQASTAQRYAHLMDDPLRAATERVGAIVAGTEEIGGDVVPLRPAHHR